MKDIDTINKMILALKEGMGIFQKKYKYAPIIQYHFNHAGDGEYVAQEVLDKEQTTVRGGKKYQLYTIQFNLDVIQKDFVGFERLIAIHELAHVFTDILSIKEGRPHDIRKHSGHPEKFFELMSLVPMSQAEKELQHKRHEVPYNFGR